MTETLPITINLNKALCDKFSKLKSISNKLEAQFNFHTLTANWYGEEDDILTIKLCIESPESFEQYQAELHNLPADEVIISHFSDDVISCFNPGVLQLLCYIAITESELSLLEQAPKILAGFLQKKLHKVLNLIALQQSLAKI